MTLKNGEVKAIWNANAAFWDDRMGEGNHFHKTLIEPVQLKLLDVKKGDRILDIACGNGHFARKLADCGARVTAVDFAESFIELARSKGTPNIEYRVVDATNEADLKPLFGTAFDSAVCTMALMDMETIEVFFRHLPKMLKKDGVFVFSVLHPCFNSGENRLVHERDDLGGEVKDNYFVKIRNYLEEREYLGVGMNGQPRSHYYFHRPVSSVLRRLFENGFVLDAFEEPAFGEAGSSGGIFDTVFSRIPPVLICRLRIRS